MLVKFFHILIAIISLGTSAGLGIVLEFYGNHPAHGGFVLRVIRRLVAVVVVPGYLLVAGTGLWMTHRTWSFTARWIQAALALWAIGAVLLGIFLAVLHKQITLFETDGPASTSYKRVATQARFVGAGVGLVVAIVVYLMVFKPIA